MSAATNGAPRTVATKIRLMRLGKKKAPQYRIVVVDNRVRRDGRVIETIGKYHPKQNPSFIEVDGERVSYWLGVGAQPTEPVRAILRVTGDWQAFRGEPAPEPMRAPDVRPDKKELFDAAAKEAAGEADAEATTPKRRTAKKAAAKTAAAEPTESSGSTEAEPAGEAEPEETSAASADTSTGASAEESGPAESSGSEPTAQSSEPAGAEQS
jgi:small subunit ribosomal protein S16